MTVSGLINKLGIPKANVSQHLSVMRMTGILKTRRDGLNIWYSITNKEIVDACGLMQNALANLMEGVAVSSKKPLLPQ